MKRELFILTLLFLFVNISMKTNAQNYDSVSFETPTSKIIIDSTNNNVWQIGTPSKNFFGSAHSGIKAILTDSINSYPINNTSAFIYVIRNPYTATCFTSMEFWHKYDMDTLTDIGVIDASYDGGKSWVLVSDTSDALEGGAWFWWDNDYHESNGNYTNHPLTTTGKSDGWIQARFNWQWYLPVQSDTIIYPLDSLMIRFKFISDSVETNKEGWMIDDIVTASAEWQDCTAIAENVKNTNISIYPNPFTTSTTFSYTLQQPSSVQITIFNHLGEQVTELRQEQSSGIQPITWNAEGLSSGIYFYRMHAGEQFASGKIILNR